MPIRVKKSAVQSVITAIEKFLDNVSGEANKMSSESEAMGASWKDAQYAEFDGFIQETVDELFKNLGTLEEFKDFLRSKLAQFDD